MVRLLLIRLHLLLLAFVATSCDSDQTRQQIRHPEAKNLASAFVDPGLVTALDDEYSDSEVVSDVARLLSTAEAEVSIGTLSGSAEQVVGVMRSGLFGPDSTLFVVDESYVVVREYTIGGAPISLIGGEGRGPGEFLAPTGVALVSSDTLYVSDSNLLVHRFLRSSSDWTYDQSIRLPFVAFDICALDGRLFVLGLQAESPEVIHEIKVDGTIANSFGVFYRSGSFLAQEAFVGFGHLACSTEKNLIVAIAPLLPEIHAYSVDGQIQWLSRISSWTALPIVENAGRRVRPDMEGIDSTSLDSHGAARS